MYTCMCVCVCVCVCNISVCVYDYISTLYVRMFVDDIFLIPIHRAQILYRAKSVHYTYVDINLIGNLVITQYLSVLYMKTGTAPVC